MTTLELLSTVEAAHKLGVVRTTVVNYVNRGIMYPATVVNTARHGAYLFAPEEVERVREQREAGIK